jgi:hypothetical protein
MAPPSAHGRQGRLMRQAQEGDFQGDVAEGLFELIAIVGE